MIDFNEMKDVAVEACLNAAEFLELENNPEVIEGETAGGIKTQQDIAVQKLINKKLEQTLIPILGEEMEKHNYRTTSWVVDPIDGSGWYSRGVPYATTAISLFVENRPELTVINNFSTKQLLVARRDQGVVINQKVVSASTRKLSEAYIEIHGDDADSTDIGFKNKIWASGGCIVNQAAIGMSLMQLAQGSLDAIVVLPTAHLSPWDYLHGYCITQESGVLISDEAKSIISSITPMTVFASNKTLSQEISALIPDIYI